MRKAQAEREREAKRQAKAEEREAKKLAKQATSQSRIQQMPINARPTMSLPQPSSLLPRPMGPGAHLQPLLPQSMGGSGFMYPSFPPTNPMLNVPSLPPTFPGTTNEVSPSTEKILSDLFEKANAIRDDEKQLISDFLYGRSSGNTGAIQILLNEERFFNSEDGNWWSEQILFELNYSTGTWRKLRRRRPIQE